MEIVRLHDLDWTEPAKAEPVGSIFSVDISTSCSAVAEHVVRQWASNLVIYQAVWRVEMAASAFVCQETAELLSVLTSVWESIYRALWLIVKRCKM